MTTTSFSLSVSYSQISVFDSKLANPFNVWTDKHVSQGFAWMAGAVSFGTTVNGRHLVKVLVAAENVELPSNAVRIIQVPFEVPSEGKT